MSAGRVGALVRPYLRPHLALAAILLLALGLRLWGVFHDLPFSYFGDELHFMKRSAALGTGDLNPHWFHKPAFLMYVLAFADGLYYLFGRLTGELESTGELASRLLVAPGPFLLIGRLVVMASGVATVLVVYLLARRVFASVAAAVAAGLIAAVLAPMVASSVVIKSDMTCGLLIALSVLAYVRGRQDERLRPLVVASLLAGAAMGTHYYGSVLVPTYVLLELWRAVERRRDGSAALGRWRRALLRAALVPVLFTAGFFATSPYNFLDPTWGRATADLVRETIRPHPEKVHFEPDTKTQYRPGREAAGSAAISFLEMLTSRKSLGLALTLMAGLGLVEVLRRRETRWYGLLVLVPCLVFFAAAITTHAFHAQPRHLNAVYALLATLVWPGALLLARAVPAARRRPGTAARLALLLTAAACVPTVLEVARTLRSINRLDSRLVAYRWIVANVPRDARILMDDYGPPVPPNAAALARQEAVLETLEPGPFTHHQHTRLDLLRRHPPRDGRDVDELGHQWWLPAEKSDEELRSNAIDLDMGNPIVSRRPATLAAYRSRGVRYVVTNSIAHDLYLHPKKGRATSFPSFARFYRELRATTPLRTFDPAAWRGKGPVVWVYDLAAVERPAG